MNTPPDPTPAKWRLLEQGEFLQEGDQALWWTPGISPDWMPIVPSEWGCPHDGKFPVRRLISSTSEKPFPMGTEARVCQFIAERQRVGLLKYGVDVAGNPLTRQEWRAHFKAELADALVYLTREEEEEAK